MHISSLISYKHIYLPPYLLCLLHYSLLYLFTYSLVSLFIFLLTYLFTWLFTHFSTYYLTCLLIFSNYLTYCLASKSNLNEYIERGEDPDSSDKPRPKSTKLVNYTPIPEVDIFIHLLVLLHSLDAKNYETVCF